jgi:LAS superfamily LD-carboxypeptidase LdcB
MYNKKCLLVRSVRFFSNACFTVSNNVTSSGINKTNKCKVNAPEMDNQTKSKPEGKIRETISIKIEEYVELISIQSPEGVKICNEINK